MFKKKLLSAAVAALLAGTAYAQLNASAPAPAMASKPVLAPAAPAPAQAPVEAAAAPQPVAAATEHPKADAINPFSGKSVSLEVRQRELETAKMETSLLEERIKQAALAEDLKTLPLKKSVEAAQATTARMKEELLQKDGSKPATGAPAATAAQAAAAPAAVVKPKTTTRPAKKAAATVKDEPVKDVASTQAPVAPKVEVTSVLSLGGVRSAVLDIDGNTLSVKHGDSTPMGAVEVLDSQSDRIVGRVYKVHGSTLARIMISDPKPVDPTKPGAAAPTSVTMGAPVASSSTLPPPASFGSSGQSGRSPALPPLQLPSGVTLIPPANSGR